MRTLATFVKTLRENIRDWKILILVIVFAPCFVYLMKMYIGDSASSGYAVEVLNLDSGSYGKELIAEWESIRSEEGTAILRMLMAKDRESARRMIKEGKADLFVTIPPDFSLSFDGYLKTRSGTVPALVSYGDPSNMRYAMAASFVDYAAFEFACSRAGIEIPMQIAYESAGGEGRISDFDAYVPALLVMAIIMILFTAGASIIREIERGTIERLSLSRLRSYEFMGALCANQVLIGILGLALTLCAAISVGYRTEGSILLILAIGTATCLAVIGIGIITATFVRNMFGLLTLGCFPFFILMFFSDCFLPLRKIGIFRLFGKQIYLNDILPTATATRAFNAVMNFDAGLSDIGFELIWILALSSLYFLLGVLLFQRKYGFHQNRRSG